MMTNTLAIEKRMGNNAVIKVRDPPAEKRKTSISSKSTAPDQSSIPKPRHRERKEVVSDVTRRGDVGGEEEDPASTSSSSESIAYLEDTEESTPAQTKGRRNSTNSLGSVSDMSTCEQTTLVDVGSTDEMANAVNKLMGRNVRRQSVPDMSQNVTESLHLSVAHVNNGWGADRALCPGSSLANSAAFFDFLGKFRGETGAGGRIVADFENGKSRMRSGRHFLPFRTSQSAKLRKFPRIPLFRSGFREPREPLFTTKSHDSANLAPPALRYTCRPGWPPASL